VSCRLHRRRSGVTRCDQAATLQQTPTVKGRCRLHA
jgi:hypothetical protein